MIDTKALKSIVNNFAAMDGGDPMFPGLLVDVDHLSHDVRNSTEAMGWLKEVEIRDGQLWGMIDWTDLGAAAISNRRFKSFSTEYAAPDLEIVEPGKVRPLALSGLALTNRPNNIGGQPISNRQEGGEENPNPHQPTNKKPMKNICAKLGLAEDAGEEQILSAIQTLQAKLKEAEGKAAEGEAEAVLNRYADRIPEGQREKWRQAAIRNRKDTEELLEGLPKTAAPGGGGGGGKTATDPIRNRAQSPAPVESGAGDEAATEAERDLYAAIRNRAEELRTESQGRRRFAGYPAVSPHRWLRRRFLPEVGWPPRNPGAGSPCDGSRWPCRQRNA